MKKQWLGILCIGIVTLTGACGMNQNQQTSDSSSVDRQVIAQPTSHEAFYQTTVFLGDSITEGLTYYDVLDEELVLAGAGKTAEFAMEDLEVLIERKPDQVFIHVGSTDILWPTEDPIAYSFAHYSKLIRHMLAELPGVEIKLLSITPVTEDAVAAEPRYRTIEDYNEGLEALASREQVGFVDLTPLVQQHTELYDADGIHFQAEFYPILLDYLRDL